MGELAGKAQASLKAGGSTNTDQVACVRNLLLADSFAAVLVLSWPFQPGLWNAEHWP